MRAASGSSHIGPTSLTEDGVKAGKAGFGSNGIETGITAGGNIDAELPGMCLERRRTRRAGCEIH